MEIDDENVELARKLIKFRFWQLYMEYNIMMDIGVSYAEAVNHIIDTNIIQGDAITYLNSDGEDAIFYDYIFEYDEDYVNIKSGSVSYNEYSEDHDYKYITLFKLPYSEDTIKHLHYILRT